MLRFGSASQVAANVAVLVVILGCGRPDNPAQGRSYAGNKHLPPRSASTANVSSIVPGHSDVAAAARATPLTPSERRGAALLAATSDSLPRFVGARMRCFSCHLGDGRRANAIPLIGSYAFTELPVPRRTRHHYLRPREQLLHAKSGRSLDFEGWTRHGRYGRVSQIPFDGHAVRARSGARLTCDAGRRRDGFLTWTRGLRGPVCALPRHRWRRNSTSAAAVGISLIRDWCVAREARSSCLVHPLQHAIRFSGNSRRQDRVRHCGLHRLAAAARHAREAERLAQRRCSTRCSIRDAQPHGF